MKIPSGAEGPRVPGGYVHLTRQIYESSLWTMPPYCVKVAMTCLALANYQDTKKFDHYAGEDVIIKRGEFITSITRLSDHAKLVTSLVRLALKKLVQHGFIKIEVKKNVETKIMVVKYNYYNDPKTYMRHGFKGGVGTPVGAETGEPVGEPNSEPVGERVGTHIVVVEEVKKKRKEEGTAPPDDFTPPEPVNAPEIFLANQFRLYISKRKSREVCALEFKEALGRGLNLSEMNACIEARWNHDVIIWDWMKAFEKEHRKKEARPPIYRASDDDKKNKKEGEEKRAPPVPDDQRIKKELHDALMKTKLQSEKSNADQPKPDEKPC